MNITFELRISGICCLLLWVVISTCKHRLVFNCSHSGWHCLIILKLFTSETDVIVAFQQFQNFLWILKDRAYGKLLLIELRAFWKKDFAKNPYMTTRALMLFYHASRFIAANSDFTNSTILTFSRFQKYWIPFPGKLLDFFFISIKNHSH